MLKLGPLITGLLACAQAMSSGAAVTFGPVVTVEGINDAGVVVGTHFDAPNRVEGFIWTEAGGFTGTGRLQSTVVIAEGWALNASSVVTGNAQLDIGTQTVRRAYHWSPTSPITEIGALPGHNWSQGIAVNDSGQITGLSAFATAASGPGPSHAFLWTPGAGGAAGGGAMIDILPAATRATGMGINNRGDVVGTFTTATSTGLEGFIYTSDTGTAQPLPTLGGAIISVGDINENRVVVGGARVSGRTEPFIWSQADGINSIVGLGGSVAQATALNEQSQVVGRSQLPGDPEYESFPGGPMVPITHAFYWDEVLGVIDVHPAGWLTSTAEGVNSSGHIVGWGLNANGERVGFVTTIPEPGSAALCLIGLVSALRQRNRASSS